MGKHGPQRARTSTATPPALSAPRSFITFIVYTLLEEWRWWEEAREVNALGMRATRGQCWPQTAWLCVKRVKEEAREGKGNGEMEKGGPKTGTDQKSQRSRARRTPQLPSKDRRRGVGTTSEAFKARPPLSGSLRECLSHNRDLSSFQEAPFYCILLANWAVGRAKMTSPYEGKERPKGPGKLSDAVRFISPPITAVAPAFWGPTEVHSLLPLPPWDCSYGFCCATRKRGCLTQPRHTPHTPLRCPGTHPTKGGRGRPVQAKQHNQFHPSVPTLPLWAPAAAPGSDCRDVSLSCVMVPSLSPDSQIEASALPLTHSGALAKSPPHTGPQHQSHPSKGPNPNPRCKQMPGHGAWNLHYEPTEPNPWAKGPQLPSQQPRFHDSLEQVLNSLSHFLTRPTGIATEGSMQDQGEAQTLPSSQITTPGTPKKAWHIKGVACMLNERTNVKARSLREQPNPLSTLKCDTGVHSQQQHWGPVTRGVQEAPASSVLHGCRLPIGAEMLIPHASFLTDRVCRLPAGPMEGWMEPWRQNSNSLEKHPAGCLARWDPSSHPGLEPVSSPDLLPPHSSLQLTATLPAPPRLLGLPPPYQGRNQPRLGQVVERQSVREGFLEEKLSFEGWGCPSWEGSRSGSDWRRAARQGQAETQPLRVEAASPYPAHQTEKEPEVSSLLSPAKFIHAPAPTKHSASLPTGFEGTQGSSVGLGWRGTAVLHLEAALINKRRGATITACVVPTNTKQVQRESISSAGSAAKNIKHHTREKTPPYTGAPNSTATPPLSSLRNTLAATHHHRQHSKLTVKAFTARATKTHLDLTSSIALVPAYPRVQGNLDPEQMGADPRRAVSGDMVHPIWFSTPPVPTPHHMIHSRPGAAHSGFPSPLGPAFSTPPHPPQLEPDTRDSGREMLQPSMALGLTLVWLWKRRPEVRSLRQHQSLRGRPWGEPQSPHLQNGDSHPVLPTPGGPCWAGPSLLQKSYLSSWLTGGLFSKCGERPLVPLHLLIRTPVALVLYAFDWIRLHPPNLPHRSKTTHCQLPPPCLCRHACLECPRAFPVALQIYRQGSCSVLCFLEGMVPALLQQPPPHRLMSCLNGPEPTSGAQADLSTGSFIQRMTTRHVDTPRPKGPGARASTCVHSPQDAGLRPPRRGRLSCHRAEGALEIDSPSTVGTDPRTGSAHSPTLNGLLVPTTSPEAGERLETQECICGLLFKHLVRSQSALLLPSEPGPHGKWAETSNLTERGLLFPSAGRLPPLAELLGQLSTYSMQGPGPPLHASHASHVSHARPAPPVKLTWKGTCWFCFLHTPLPPHSPQHTKLVPHSESQSASSGRTSNSHISHLPSGINPGPRVMRCFFRPAADRNQEFSPQSLWDPGTGQIFSLALGLTDIQVRGGTASSTCISASDIIPMVVGAEKEISQGTWLIQGCTGTARRTSFRPSSNQLNLLAHHWTGPRQLSQPLYLTDQQGMRHCLPVFSATELEEISGPGKKSLVSSSSPPAGSLLLCTILGRKPTPGGNPSSGLRTQPGHICQPLFTHSHVLISCQLPLLASAPPPEHSDTVASEVFSTQHLVSLGLAPSLAKDHVRDPCTGAFSMFGPASSALLPIIVGCEGATLDLSCSVCTMKEERLKEESSGSRSHTLNPQDSLPSPYLGPAPLCLPQEFRLGTAGPGPEGGRLQGQEEGWGEAGATSLKGPDGAGGRAHRENQRTEATDSAHHPLVPNTVPPKRTGPSRDRAHPLGNPALPGRMLDGMASRISSLPESLGILPQDKRGGWGLGKKRERQLERPQRQRGMRRPPRGPCDLSHPICLSACHLHLIPITSHKSPQEPREDEGLAREQDGDPAEAEILAVTADTSAHGHRHCAKLFKHRVLLESMGPRCNAVSALILDQDSGQRGPAAYPTQALQGPQNQNSIVECEKGPTLSQHHSGHEPFIFTSGMGRLSHNARWDRGMYRETRSNGILLPLGANSRNDSAPPTLKGQPGTAGLGGFLICVAGADDDNGEVGGDNHMTAGVPTSSPTSSNSSRELPPRALWHQHSSPSLTGLAHQPRPSVSVLFAGGCGLRKEPVGLLEASLALAAPPALHVCTVSASTTPLLCLIPHPHLTLQLLAHNRHTIPTAGGALGSQTLHQLPGAALQLALAAAGSMPGDGCGSFLTKCTSSGLGGQGEEQGLCLYTEPAHVCPGCSPAFVTEVSGSPAPGHCIGDGGTQPLRLLLHGSSCPLEGRLKHMDQTGPRTSLSPHSNELPGRNSAHRRRHLHQHMITWEIPPGSGSPSQTAGTVYPVETVPLAPNTEGWICPKDRATQPEITPQWDMSRHVVDLSARPAGPDHTLLCMGWGGEGHGIRGREGEKLGVINPGQKNAPRCPPGLFLEHKLLGQQDSLPGQQCPWESKASTLTCHSSSMTSGPLWPTPCLALLLSLHCDPAPGPAIPILRNPLLLSNPISPTDLDSLQPSEQPGVKSQIQEQKLTLNRGCLRTLTPLDGEPARKPPPVRTACQSSSSDLPWILSAQVVGVYGEEGPAKLLKAFALAASTAQNTFPPKGDAVLISQASARVPPQRETFRTVLSDAAHDIHHKSSGLGPAHCCVPLSKHRKWALNIGRVRETLPEVSRTMNIWCQWASDKALDLRAAAPRQGSSDLPCSQVTRWGPYLSLVGAGEWRQGGGRQAECQAAAKQNLHQDLTGRDHAALTDGEQQLTRTCSGNPGGQSKALSPGCQPPEPSSLTTGLPRLPQSQTEIMTPSTKPDRQGSPTVVSVILSTALCAPLRRQSWPQRVNCHLAELGFQPGYFSALNYIQALGDSATQHSPERERLIHSSFYSKTPQDPILGLTSLSLRTLAETLSDSVKTKVAGSGRTRIWIPALAQWPFSFNWGAQEEGGAQEGPGVLQIPASRPKRGPSCLRAHPPRAHRTHMDLPVNPSRHQGPEPKNGHPEPQRAPAAKLVQGYTAKRGRQDLNLGLLPDHQAQCFHPGACASTPRLGLGQEVLKPQGGTTHSILPMRLGGKPSHPPQDLPTPSNPPLMGKELIHSLLIHQPQDVLILMTGWPLPRMPFLIELSAARAVWTLPLHWPSSLAICFSQDRSRACSNLQS
ncbi:hypothetical protein Cadr_000004877 [Camelus dromedarius]|uniref:Uncharacterized protein n=1 Tax=Camelus dromedarius TaxID=9838 RepID=A0A5N4EBU7_CAMDR|nr:hypothetical protein Cadr_000004877 [Camelus dromedarius]